MAAYLMTKILNTIEAGFNRFIGFLIALVAASIGLFAVLIPLNLLLIKMHWGALGWLNEAVEYALYVGVFLGAPWVLQQGAHVRVDLFYSALPIKYGVHLERLLDTIGVVLCLTLFVYGVRGGLWEFEDGTLPDKNLRIANWYMLLVFSISFLMMAVEFLFRMRRAGTIVEEDSSSSTKAAF